MSIGARDQKIVFQRAAITSDALNSEVQTWGTYAIAQAKVFFGKGDERRQAAVEEGSQAATFQVRENTLTRSVTLKDRISGLGSLWDIESISPHMPKRGTIEFTAVRAL